jgi:hypothetical protein
MGNVFYPIYKADLRFRLQFPREVPFCATYEVKAVLLLYDVS